MEDTEIGPVEAVGLSIAALLVLLLLWWHGVSLMPPMHYPEGYEDGHKEPLCREFP